MSFLSKLSFEMQKVCESIEGVKTHLSKESVDKLNTAIKQFQLKLIKENMYAALPNVVTMLGEVRKLTSGTKTEAIEGLQKQMETMRKIFQQQVKQTSDISSLTAEGLQKEVDRLILELDALSLSLMNAPTPEGLVQAKAIVNELLTKTHLLTTPNPKMKFRLQALKRHLASLPLDGQYKMGILGIRSRLDALFADELRRVLTPEEQKRRAAFQQENLKRFMHAVGKKLKLEEITPLIERFHIEINGPVPIDLNPLQPSWLKWAISRHTEIWDTPTGIETWEMVEQEDPSTETRKLLAAGASPKELVESDLYHYIRNHKIDASLLRELIFAGLDLMAPQQSGGANQASGGWAKTVRGTRREVSLELPGASLIRAAYFAPSASLGRLLIYAGVPLPTGKIDFSLEVLSKVSHDPAHEYHAAAQAILDALAIREEEITKMELEMQEQLLANISIGTNPTEIRQLVLEYALPLRSRLENEPELRLAIFERCLAINCGF